MSRPQSMHSALTTVREVPGLGITHAEGTTVPSDAATGYAPGCIFQHLDGSAGTVLYINQGTASSCDFNRMDLTTAELAAVTTAGSLGLGDLTATPAELNRVADKSASVITSTATSLSVTVTAHGSRTIVLSCATTCAVALPVAAGTGETFTMIVGAASTDGNKVIAANGTDIIQGMAFISTPSDTDTAKLLGFSTSATSDKITFNQTTSGGGKGDKLVLIDYAANTWHAMVHGSGTTDTGGPATPFSET